MSDQDAVDRDALGIASTLVDELLQQRPVLVSERDALTRCIEELVAAGPDTEEACYKECVTAWQNFTNALEHAACCALATESVKANVAIFLLGSQLIEFAKNLIETAEVLQLKRPSRAIDPVELVKEQPRAYENIQKCICAWFPEERIAFEELFSGIGLPVAGFPKDEDAGSSKRADPVMTAAEVVVLHISDLHRTLDEPVKNSEVVSDLLKALRDIDNVEKVDLIVLSGDIVQSASQKEYDEARECIKALTEKLLGGDATKLIVVPGNHDVDWSRGSSCGFELRRVKEGERTDKTRDMGQVEIASPERGIAIPRASELPQFLSNFRSFYKSLTGTEYPDDVSRQTTRHVFPALKLAIMGVNTCRGMHHFCSSADVDRQALIEGIDDLDKGDRTLIRVCVGHHGPVTQRGQHDGVDSWVFDRLRGGNFALYMHGHVHESRCVDVGYGEGRGMAAIGVGSVAAGYVERPEAAPRLYHLMRFNILGPIARILVRRKERRDLPWKRDLRYLTTQTDELRAVLR